VIDDRTGPDAAETVRFGDFTIDPVRREIRHQGREIDVQPRVFDLLVYLARHRDRAVGKDELQDAVWPGMIITETALTRAIMKARKAVGDDASRQAVIKTLHGHGYRFVAPVARPAEGGGSPSPTAGPATGEERDTTRRPRSFAWLAIIVVAAMAVVLWPLLRPPVLDGSVLRIAVLPVANDTGDRELDWMRLGLMSFANGMFKSDGQIPVVSETSVVSLADNLGWSGHMGGDDGTELMDRLRRVYGATHVLAMQLEDSGDALRMNYGLHAPGDRLQRGTMVGSDGPGLAQGVVRSVYGNLLGRMRPDSDLPAVSDDPFINEAFARGMGLRAEGRCEEALPFFRVVMDQQAGLESPRYAYGACLRELGEWQEAETVLVALAGEQQQDGPDSALGETLNTIGVLYNRTGRLDEGQRHYESALAVAEQVGDDELRARVLVNLAIIADDRSEFALAEEFLDRAMLAYREAGRETLPGGLFSTMANLHMSRGELAEADSRLKLALEAYREVGDRRREAMMLNNTGYLRRLQGRFDEAETFHLQSLEIRRDIGDRVGIGRVYNMLAIVHTSRGDYEAAAGAAQSAIDIARETRDRLFEATALSQLADSEKRLGENGAARQHYLEARSIFAEIEDHMRQMQADLKLARLSLDEGGIDEAVRVGESVRETSVANGLMQPEVQATELLGDAAMAAGDITSGLARYSEALKRVRESSWSGKENTLLIKLANARLDAGDTAAAEPLVGALTQQEANIQSLKVQARFAFESGDAAKAVDMMERAKQLAGDLWADESEAAYRVYRDGLSQHEESR
jgi:DNA-binding winged helix-turn-helix (wHTH) protein/tetratricopeptide (TPR) repeat protein